MKRSSCHEARRFWVIEYSGRVQRRFGLKPEKRIEGFSSGAAQASNTHFIVIKHEDLGQWMVMRQHRANMSGNKVSLTGRWKQHPLVVSRGEERFILRAKRTGGGLHSYVAVKYAICTLTCTVTAQMSTPAAAYSVRYLEKYNAQASSNSGSKAQSSGPRGAHDIFEFDFIQPGGDHGDDTKRRGRPDAFAKDDARLIKGMIAALSCAIEKCFRDVSFTMSS